MGKKRVAVIGVGHLGKFHAEKFAAMADVEFVGIVDSNRTHADNLAQKLNTQAFYDYKDIDGLVDAVSIAVPTTLHYTVAKYFLERNVDIMLEKPIASSLQEADELIALAAKNQLILQVGHLERFNPALISLQKEIDYPLFVESHRLSVFNTRCLDVSVVLDLMIHDLDIILSMVNSPVEAIHASGAPVISPLIDIANVRIEFESGCVANITASRVSVKKQRRMRIFQKDAYLSVDFDKSEATLIKRTGSSGGLIPGMDIRTEKFSEVDNLRAELVSFIACVQNRTMPKVSGVEARKAMQVAADIITQIDVNMQKVKKLYDK